MQIVIDISENLYKATKNGLDSDEIWDLRVAVVNGILLPKGHGRLIDADALETEMVNGIKAGLYEEGYETFAHINNMDDCVECVKYADTIIEADGAVNN